MKKSVLLAFLILGSAVHAQILNPGPYIQGAKEDMNYLGGEYLRPYGKAMSTGLNNGWYTTAKTHKLGRFDLLLTPTVVFIPNADRTFVIEESRLQELELVDPNDNITPTAAGANEPGPRLRYDNNLVGTTFNAPSGTGVSVFPFLATQLNVGLVKNTDIAIRYIPRTAVPGIEGGRVGLYGFGVKHDILQWLPAGDKLPFSAAAFFGYTRLDFDAPIEDGSDGKEIVMVSQGFTARALISKKLAFVTFYGGVGYNNGSADININGTYRYRDPVGGSETTITDPVAVNATNNGMIGQVGVRFKFLWVVCIAADYTFGAYDAATLGAGVSIDF